MSDGSRLMFTTLKCTWPKYSFDLKSIFEKIFDSMTFWTNYKSFSVACFLCFFGCSEEEYEWKSSSDFLMGFRKFFNSLMFCLNWKLLLLKKNWKTFTRKTISVFKFFRLSTKFFWMMFLKSFFGPEEQFGERTFPEKKLEEHYFLSPNRKKIRQRLSILN